MARVAPLTEYVENYLKQNGPSRSSKIREKAPDEFRGQMNTNLTKMYKDEVLERQVDGFHKGKPVYLYALPGMLKGYTRPQVVFRADAILKEFQAAARAKYGVELNYIDRLSQEAA